MDKQEEIIDIDLNIVYFISYSSTLLICHPGSSTTQIWTAISYLHSIKIIDKIYMALHWLLILILENSSTA